MVLSLGLGRYPVSVWEIVRIILTTSPVHATGTYSNVPWVVVEIVRIPRILIVTLCGAGLALSGGAMQGVFRNPLVGPEIAGVSSGASFGGVLAIMLSLPMFGVIGLAFGFGLLAVVIAFALAKLSGKGNMLALVLSGVFVGAFFTALVGSWNTPGRFATHNCRVWSIGYWEVFSVPTQQKLAIVSVYRLCLGSLLMLRWRINLFSLGDLDAASHSALTLRSFAGPSSFWYRLLSPPGPGHGVIGWVGFIVPHFARMIIGPDHTSLLPVSAMLGGIYFHGMDDISRTIFSSRRFPWASDRGSRYARDLLSLLEDAR